MTLHSKNLIRISISLAACLVLSACFEEEETPADVAPISVAALGNAVWPANGTRDGDITPGTATDPFAQNNMIVLDMSGSMASKDCAGDYFSRADAAKAALLSWIAANPGDNVGLVSFSAEGTQLDFSLGRGDEHAREVVDRIKALGADGGTPLLSAMQIAREELENQAVRQGGTGAYRLIVITDGQASSGESPAPVVGAVFDNPANMIEIHTIGFCIEGGHSLKDPTRVFYTDANSPDDLRSGLDATSGEASDFDPADINFEELEP